VTAFGANPRCSNEIEKPFDGPLRIIAFDLTGKKLTSVDIPFQSDNQQAGKYLYNGPDGHLVVYTTLSVGRNELTMLSGTDLTTLQKLEFEGSVTPTGDGQRHWVSAPGFEGTTAEHHWIVFRHFRPYTRLGDHSGLYYTF